MAKRQSKPAAACGATHIALLRGINVGGNRIVPMAALRAIFEEAGCANVRTHIQSGNLVFDAVPSRTSGALEVVGRQLMKRFGFQPAIVLRSAQALMRVIATNPFLQPGIDIKTLHVGFLQESPSAQSKTLLDPARSPGDEFLVRGREIFLHLPNGVSASKLTSPYFDAILKSPSTFRNWRTVLRLAEMAGDKCT